MIAKTLVERGILANRLGTFPDSVTAMQGYTQLHREAPESLSQLIFWSTCFAT